MGRISEENAQARRDREVMERPQCLIVMDPRERGLLVHALELALASPGLGGGRWVSDAAREEARGRLTAVLDAARAKPGGFRLDTRHAEVWWSAEMVIASAYQDGVDENGQWERMTLATALRERMNGLPGCPGFDPEAYSPLVPSPAPVCPYR